jgi:hypothetical protein
MLRKLLFGSVASLALLSPVALSKAEACDSPRCESCHRHYYRVYVRDWCGDCWHYVGKFRHFWAAESVADDYRDLGYDAFVR